jgi:hypothetical protein
MPWDNHVAAGIEIELDQASPAFRRGIAELTAALSDDFALVGSDGIAGPDAGRH